MKVNPDLVVPPLTCPCGGCAALADELRGDAAMLTLYRKKLLVRGWAGKSSDAEKAYQKAHATWATVNDGNSAGAEALAAYRKASKNVSLSDPVPANAGTQTFASSSLMN